MFLVKPETVDALLKAQTDDLRGRLRLDVSSRVVPDRLEELDIAKAQQAVGERFMRTVAGFVDGVTVDWPRGHPAEQVPIMLVSSNSKKRHVEYQSSRLTNDLMRVFGLRPKEQGSLRALAEVGFDFFNWLQQEANMPIWKSQGLALHPEGPDRWMISLLGIPYDDHRAAHNGDRHRQQLEFDLREGKLVPMRR